MELSVHDQKLDDMSNAIKDLKQEIQMKDNHIQKLEEKIDELEQYSRRNCLIISGIGETENENTDRTFLKFANDVLKAEIKPEDIDRTHRLPRPPGHTNGHSKPRNLVVKFTTYNARKRVYDKRTELKHLKQNIFINENLTKTRNELFYEARKMVKDKKVKSAWTIDGNIFIRDNEDRPRKIKNKSEITQYRALNPGWSLVTH